MSIRSFRVWLSCASLAVAPSAVRCAVGAPVSPSCSTQWRAVFGTSLDDRITSVVSDASGNLFIAGYRGGLLGVEDYWPVGDSIGFVRKLDSGGSLLWEHSFNTPGTDSVEAIALTPSGRLVLAGRTDNAFPGFVSGGQLDMFAAELTDTGDVLALGQYGDERPQHPISIAVQSDDTFAIAGYDDIYVIGNAVMDWTDGFIAKFIVDDAGGIGNVWWIQDNSIVADEVTGAADAGDGSGDIFVTRIRSDSPAHGGGTSVERISGQGSLLWRASISPISLDFIAGVVVSHSGRLYVAGTTIAGLYGLPLGDSDGFLAELDPMTGDTVWGRQIGSSQPDWFPSISIDAAGDLIMAGNSAGAIQSGHVSSGYDPFVLVMTSEGQALGAWQGQQATGDDGTYAAAMIECPDVIAFAGSLSGIAPPANLGRTDAELTLVRIDRFDRIMADGFETGP